MPVSFNVTAAWNRTPPNYTAGEQVTATITGGATNTTGDVVETWGPASIPVVSDSGVQSSVDVSAFQVTRPGTTFPEGVRIDQSRPIAGIGTRAVTYSADGKSFTVTA